MAETAASTDGKACYEVSTDLTLTVRNSFVHLEVSSSLETLLTTKEDIEGEMEPLPQEGG